MIGPKLIWDNGTPQCLPSWACSELVSLRLATMDLARRNAELYQQLKLAHGASPEAALLAGLGELQRGADQ